MVITGTPFLAMPPFLKSLFLTTAYAFINIFDVTLCGTLHTFRTTFTTTYTSFTSFSWFQFINTCHDFTCATDQLPSCFNILYQKFLLICSQTIKCCLVNFTRLAINCISKIGTALFFAFLRAVADAFCWALTFINASFHRRRSCNQLLFL